MRSWLGTEVAVGVLDVPPDGSDPMVLGFAEVTDRSGLEGALKKEKDVEAAGTHGGFDLFKDSKGSAFVGRLGRHRAGRELAGRRRPPRSTASPPRATASSDSADYKDTLATLPSDNIVVGYAPGSTLQKLVTLAQTRARGHARTGAAGSADQISSQLAGIRSLGFSLDATDKGLRTRGTTLLNGKATGLPEPFSPDLLSRVPANSWFAASFGNLDASIKQAADQALKTNPAAQKQVSQVEAAARHQAGRPLRAALRRPGHLRRARRSALGGPDPAPGRRGQGRRPRCGR